MIDWNPWHGCHKISPGCQNCYMYRADAKYHRDSTTVVKTQDFYLPLKKNRARGYKIPAGETVGLCFTSDFLIEEADAWRTEIWEMIRQRADLEFLFITKRIHRFYDCIPADWGDGYQNVSLFCTVENQDRADYRLPLLKEVPAKRKGIVLEPLLERVELSAWLGGWVSEVICGGESGEEARLCDYAWILGIRSQCIAAGVSFRFKQTGAKFYKDGRLYRIKRKFQHSQARKAGIDFCADR